MNELQIFAFGDSLVRTVQKDGEPWWIARDVCAVLGLGIGTRASHKFARVWTGIRLANDPGEVPLWTDRIEAAIE